MLCPPGSPTNDRPAEMLVGAEAKRLRLDVAIVSSPYELIAATDVAHRGASAVDRPTAAFCFSDSIAYGVYAACRDSGWGFPTRSR